MRIYVTGATGMVGKNICNNEQFKKHDLLAPTRAEVDLFNYSNVEKFILDSKPDLIIHCAGKVGGIQANIANPVDFLVQNMDINRNLIMAARNSKIKKMINLGSSCMYPRLAPNPLREDMILKGELEPTNEGYALAKIMAERLCRYIFQEDKSYNYKTIIPSNLFGYYDHFDPKTSHLIPAIIRKIDDAKSKKINHVEIWGNGEAKREFMFTEDLVDCLYQATSNYESLPQVMNAGLGFDYTINEYYQTAAEVIGFKGQFTHDLTKPVGMKQKLTSVDLAKTWGWVSKTTLKEGLEKTYKHYLKIKES